MAWWLIIPLVFALLFGFVVFRGAPYVPSKKRDVQAAFDTVYQLSSQDTLVDIGSGDGLVLREAAARGALAVGYELNPLLVVISRVVSREQPRVRVQLADFWRTPLPDTTTIVYTFGDARDITKMAARVEQEATRLGRPLFFLSYAFLVPGRQPVAHTTLHFLYKIDPLQREKP